MCITKKACYISHTFQVAVDWAIHLWKWYRVSYRVSSCTTSFHSFVCMHPCRLMYMIIPVYIAEMSSKKARGRLGSLIGPGYNIGILLGAVCNIGFARFSLGWRVSSGIQAILAVAYTVCVCFIPHTPRCVFFPLILSRLQAKYPPPPHY